MLVGAIGVHAADTAARGLAKLSNSGSVSLAGRAAARRVSFAEHGTAKAKMAPSQMSEGSFTDKIRPIKVPKTSSECCPQARPKFSAQ